MAPRMPWNEKLYQLEGLGGGEEPLCFGFMWDNGEVKPNPPYYRAMEMAKSALEKAGHKGGSEPLHVRPWMVMLTISVLNWTFPDTVKQKNLLVSITSQSCHNLSSSAWCQRNIEASSMST